jgi:hypothetical protein
MGKRTLMIEFISDLWRAFHGAAYRVWQRLNGYVAWPSEREWYRGALQQIADRAPTKRKWGTHDYPDGRDGEIAQHLDAYGAGQYDLARHARAALHGGQTINSFGRCRWLQRIKER